MFDTSVTKYRVYFRRHWAHLLLLVAAFFGTLLIGDLAISWTLCRDGKLFGRPLPPYSLTFNDEQVRHLQQLDEPKDPYGQFDAELGWSIRPSGVSANGQFRANAQGYRGNHEYALDKPTDVLRIACFGDSYTHGDTVGNDDMWTQRLEGSDSTLEVLNFGVNGYGTDQAYLRYLRDGVPFKADVVLIGLMVENILRNVSVYRPAYNHGTDAIAVKPRFRLASDGTLELVRCPAQSPQELKNLVESRRLQETLFKTDYWVRRAPKAYQGSVLFWSSLGRIAYAAYERRHPPDVYYRDVDGEPFQVTAQILREFHAKALSNGAKRAVVLIFPGEGEIAEQLAGRPFWETMKNQLQADGIEVIDFTPTVAEAVRREGINTYYRIGHFSPKGNAVVADTLRATLFPSIQ